MSRGRKEGIALKGGAGVGHGALGWERPPGMVNGTPLKNSCLENPMDRILEGYSPWGCKELNMTEHSQAHMENFETHRKFGIHAVAMGCLWRVLRRELMTI